MSSRWHADAPVCVFMCGVRHRRGGMHQAPAGRLGWRAAGCCPPRACVQLLLLVVARHRLPAAAAVCGGPCKTNAGPSTSSGQPPAAVVWDGGAAHEQPPAAAAGRGSPCNKVALSTHTPAACNTTARNAAAAALLLACALITAARASTRFGAPVTHPPGPSGIRCHASTGPPYCGAHPAASGCQHICTPQAPTQSRLSSPPRDVRVGVPVQGSRIS